MTMKSPSKSRLSPRSATWVGSKVVVKGHRARHTVAKAPKAVPVNARATKTTVPPKAPRRTRGDEVMELLQRKEGATVDEMVKRFGLLAHTLRAIISIEGRKRGIKVERIGKAHYRVA